MRTYHTNDGEVIAADDARDVVRKLRGMSNTPEQNIQVFMEEVAARVLAQQNEHIPTDSPTNFVAGLVDAGLLIEEA